MEKEVKMTEKITEKEPLAEGDDIMRKELTKIKTEPKTEETEMKCIEQSTDKKLPDVDDPFLLSDDDFTDDRKKHQRKREDEGNRCKTKHRIEIFDNEKSSQKKRRRHHSRGEDSDSEMEEGEIPRRKVNRYHSPSPPTDNCNEEDDQKEIKKEMDNSMHPAPSIEQESLSAQGMYRCDICNISLNSDVTYQSHIAGKKHKKNLNAKNIAESEAAQPDIKGQKIVEFAELFKSYSHPDPSKGGFYCKICNSHSNSSSMWEAHIIGKRHIANLKKAPGAAPSKSRNVPAPPGTIARLMSQLKYINEPVVGLDQIREIQRSDCDFVSYTCFLCGGISVCEEEIIDHILLMKHREKYLEKISCLEYETIRNCQMSVRGTLVAELCERVEAERGRGKPEVYYDKNSLVKMENKLL